MNINLIKATVIGRIKGTESILENVSSQDLDLPVYQMIMTRKKAFEDVLEDFIKAEKNLVIKND